MTLDASARTILLLDVGEPVVPVRPPSWREVRRAALDAQAGRCAVCGSVTLTKAGKPRLDVHLAASGIAVGLCQSHRLRHDAPTRIPAGVRTRAMNRGSPVIPVPRTSHASPAGSASPDDLLVIEAVTRAHVDGAVTSPDAACRALLSVLRERGMLAESVAVVTRKRRLGVAPAEVGPSLFASTDPSP